MRKLKEKFNKQFKRYENMINNTPEEVQQANPGLVYKVINDCNDTLNEIKEIDPDVVKEVLRRYRNE